MRAISFLFIFWIHPLHAAFEQAPAGGRANGMAGVVMGMTGDPWGVIGNPAMLPTLRGRSFSVASTPRLWGFSELTRVSVCYVEPFSNGGVALSASRFGFDLYRELSATLSAGFAPVTPFRVGVSVSWYSLSIKDYGSAASLCIDAGCQISISGELEYGLSFSNLTAGTIGSQGEPLPQVIATGLMYHPVTGASLGLDVVKDVAFPATFRVGAEYVLTGIVPIRGGLSSDPAMATGGLGIHTSLFQLDYAFAVHPLLGMNHHFSLTIEIGGR